MTVQIIDENDNAPRFSPTLYLETVVESSEPDTEVVVVTATDSDLDAVIRYQLVDTFGKFDIDPVVSVLYLQRIEPNKQLSQRKAQECRVVFSAFSRFAHFHLHSYLLGLPNPTFILVLLLFR